MIRKLKNKLNNSAIFKFRFVIIIFAIFCIGTYSIGYAFFSQQLDTLGTIDVVMPENKVVVSSISGPTVYKEGAETAAAIYTGSQATFSVQLPRTNSTLTYSITVRNNGSQNQVYDVTSITTNNDAITYTLSGIDQFTILSPGEEKTFNVEVGYTEEYQYDFPTSKTAVFTLDFSFLATSREQFVALTGYIVEDSGDVSSSEYGAPATIFIQNDNSISVAFTLSGQNNFIVYNSNGEETSYYLPANSSDTFSIYIKDSDLATAIGTSAVVNIMATVINNESSESFLIDNITLSLENKAKYEILSDGYSETSSTVDYSGTSTSQGGIFLEEGIDGGSVYYYRGAVSDNYFSFAGYTWRILRIDENANMRLVLNGLLTNSSGSVITSKFKTTSSASSIDEAKILARLINDASSTTANSPLYGYLQDTSTTTLRGWYNNNIAGTSYEQYVVDSVFCMDTEGGNAVSSGTATSVYYFAAYQKIGQDTALYDPKFTCPADGQITEKVGLLTADEYVLAGGAYNVSNTSFFLNDSGISNSWWTMSPGYYDPTLSTVGVFYVDSSGKISDWPNNQLLTNAFGIRPVITVNGSLEITGDGTSSNPFKFV